jgi:hypothetical protein
MVREQRTGHCSNERPAVDNQQIWVFREIAGEDPTNVWK